MCENGNVFIFIPLFYVLTVLQRKWPEEKIPVGIDTIRNFNVRAKVVGPSVRSFS